MPRLKDEWQVKISGAAELIEVSGRVSWYSAVRGFGYISCEKGFPDMRLTAAVMRARGGCVARGARITCTVLKRANGYEIISVTSLLQEPDSPPETTTSEGAQVPAEHDFRPVRCKWYDRVRGFGFLVADGELEIFVHAETVHRAGMHALAEQEMLLAAWTSTKKGLMAVALKERR